MDDEPEHAKPVEDLDGSLLVLAPLALVAGAATGIVGALFRLSLEQADRLRDALIWWAHGQPAIGFIVVVSFCGAAAALATTLVRRYAPQASGSGIPHVEAVLHQELPPAPFVLVPVKFIGGLLAIGSGLALGREGPSVQMGASLAHLVGTISRRSWSDCRVLIAAGAGAGLATAFNAPIAGAIFVLEELVQRFEHRIAIAALGASATAIAVGRVFLGDAPDFHVASISYAYSGAKPLYYVLGALAGLFAIAYNHTILATLAFAEQLHRLSAEFRAGLVGLAVGVLAWFAPDLVGGGDAITHLQLPTFSTEL
jgi:chloride channel protein, CIC family